MPGEKRKLLRYEDGIKHEYDFKETEKKAHVMMAHFISWRKGTTASKKFQEQNAIRREIEWRTTISYHTAWNDSSSVT